MRDDSFWTWPTDVAAKQTHFRSLVIAAVVFYLVGAGLMLVQARFGLTCRWSRFGVGLILVAVAGCFAVCAKVMRTRSRLSYH